MKIDCFVLDFVEKHLSGHGLELGAQAAPFKTNQHTSMSYADKYTVDEMFEDLKVKRQIKKEDITKPDFIVFDAFSFDIVDDFFDFFCCSHVIEHTCNPIGAIEEWLRVVKPGGYVYFICPDKRETFDYDRPITPVSHLVEDYENDSVTTEYAHYLDCCTIINKAPTEAQRYYINQKNIHVHVFTEESIMSLLSYIKKFFEFDILDIKKEGMHVACLLQKKVA